MGQKELLRVKVMEQVVEQKLNVNEAARRLGLSTRQVLRLKKRYEEEGDRGLLHKNRGKPSAHGYAEAFRQQVLCLYRAHYEDFGPTLAAEKLATREGIKVDHETLRRWLIAEGLWERKRRRKAYRSRRRRRECFGELLQFDGSHHDWFEGRRSPCCLMNMVDDATGTTLSFFTEEETTAGAMQLLWKWIVRYGIPQGVYCDKKNAFVLTREPTIEEQLKGIEPQSPFECACEKLGIEVIVANSPQAKGRVERSHAVYQDRLVKEMRLEGISSIEAANWYLEKVYLPAINKKFAKESECFDDAHVPCGELGVLEDIFCFEEPRVMSNDYVVSYKRKLFQILRTNTHLPRPREKLLVRELLDGRIKLLHNDAVLNYTELHVKPRKEELVTLCQ